MGGDETVPEPGSSSRPRRAAARRRSDYEEALHFLARRPRTAIEVRRMLEKRKVEAAEVEGILARLAGAGYLDDARLALDFVSTRSARAPRRLLGELERRGVAPETARAALARAIEEGQVEPEKLLREQVRRRLARERGPLDRRALTRVYTALLRAGFDGDAARGELERLGESLGESDGDSSRAGGIDDDLA